MSLLGDGTLRLQGRERDRQSWQASPVDVGMQRRFLELLRGVSVYSSLQSARSYRQVTQAPALGLLKSVDMS